MTLFILDSTHSPAHAGFVGTLAALPYLLFGLPAGRPGRSAGIFFQSIGEAIPFLADTGEHTGLHMRALMDRARVVHVQAARFLPPAPVSLLCRCCLHANRSSLHPLTCYHARDARRAQGGAVATPT